MCAYNECTCDNGIPGFGPNCEVDGSKTCMSCDEGFNLNEANLCVENQCFCENGTSASGKNCRYSRFVKV